MNANNPQSWVLPAEVLVSIATLLEPTHRGVARHVSRDWRVAVRAVAEAGEGDGMVDNSSFRLRASSLCGSLDLVQWGRGGQGCPWPLNKWMEKAAGEVNVPRGEAAILPRASPYRLLSTVLLLMPSIGFDVCCRYYAYYRLT
jgi:hypothetical protein